MTKIKIESIIWDEWNVAHIAKHKIVIEEVEQVLQSDFIFELANTTSSTCG